MALRRYDMDESSSLHLPRILMFHGGGTNKEIFQLQCRPLMRRLRGEYRFCFVQAPYLSEPTEKIERSFKGMGPYRTWLRWRESDEMREHGDAVRLIEDAINFTMEEDDRKGADGEWVGVMGFSQGAKLGASILLTNQFRSEQGLGGLPAWPQFKFGILLAGRGPLVWMDEDESAMPEGLVLTAAMSTVEHADLPLIPMEQRLSIPALHVHGLLDPGVGLHRRMFKRYCRTDLARLLEWQGDHMVPIKTADVSRLAEEIRLVATEAMSRGIPDV